MEYQENGVLKYIQNVESWKSLALQYDILMCSSYQTKMIQKKGL